MDCSEFSCAGKPPKNATFQTPNIKHQTPKNPQAPNPKIPGPRIVLPLGILGFSGVWCLVFGVWCLEGGVLDLEFPSRNRIFRHMKAARTSLLYRLARVPLFAALATLPLLVDDWPQWLGPQRDGVLRENCIVEKFPAKGPKVRWRTAIGGGYTGPAVANGRVYVLDRQLGPGASNPSNPFAKVTIPGSERVLCLDAADGAILWTYEYDCPYTVSYPAGPRATPAVDRDRIYTVGAEGNLLCLDAEKGNAVWSHDLKKDYGIPTPTWGFAGHPLIDGGKIICLAGGEGSVAVAFDKETGKELWRALSAKEP